mgnify:CR=1 FL=1
MIISNVLLELREKFRWNLVRISDLELQVQVALESGNPIIGIDYSPQVLFKDKKSLKGEPQYNYNLQRGNENLALVLGGDGSDLKLVFQSKHLGKSTYFCLKNLKTGKCSSKALCQKFERKILPLNIREWDEALRDARNQSIALNISKLLSHESSTKYPLDEVLLEETDIKIVIENNFELSISSEEFSEDLEPAESVYKEILSNYFSSSGREIKWEQVRNDVKLKLQ